MLALFTLLVLAQDPRPSVIRGYMLDLQDAIIPDGPVHLLNERGDIVQTSMPAHPDLHFHFEVPAGRYRIHVPGKYWILPHLTAILTAKAGETHRLDLPLIAGGGVAFIVPDGDVYYGPDFKGGEIRFADAYIRYEKMRQIRSGEFELNGTFFQRDFFARRSGKLLLEVKGGTVQVLGQEFRCQLAPTTSCIASIASQSEYQP